MPRELMVLMAGQLLGTVSQNARGDLALTYAPEWRNSPNSYALSLSMPLASRTHGDGVVRPYLEGLLPDSQNVLERWARQFHTSARNPFGLLAHMGEACAGARSADLRREYPREKFCRDFQIGSIYEGTCNMQIQTIATGLNK